jgi:hypothetical protein
MARKAARAPLESHAFKILFVSNQEPVSDVDVDYLHRAFLAGHFQYVRITDAEDLLN